jgi:hypothetical protein
LPNAAEEVKIKFCIFKKPFVGKETLMFQKPHWGKAAKR